MSATLGIRREDKAREMRAPLAPSHVAALIARGLRVLVQPSRIRVYLDTEYLAAGAELREDLSDADCVLGVKEVALDQLLPGRTMLFFARSCRSGRARVFRGRRGPSQPPLAPHSRAPQTCTRRRRRACRCWTPCWRSACA